MTNPNTIKRALEKAGFVHLRGGWVRKEAAPRLQDRIAKAVSDVADDVAAIRAALTGDPT
jgi:hypothetical protein